MEKTMKVLADGSIEISNVDGLSMRNTGRNIRDIVDIERYMRENTTDWRVVR